MPEIDQTQLRIVNPQPQYAALALMPPPATGYLHVAATVDSTLGRTPFPRRSAHRAALLARLKPLSRDLERLDGVVKVTVYRAVLMPPPGGYAREHAARPARSDVVVLVETTSTEVVAGVRESEPWRRLLDVLGQAARETHVMEARCAKCIADVDKTRQGLFLFNHFVAADAEVALRLWDFLAAWYVVETGMDNSTLLVPTQDDDYVFVNHARWDHGLLRFALDQFGKRSFRRFVLANLRANHVGAMPILYRLAWARER